MTLEGHQLQHTVGLDHSHKDKKNKGGEAEGFLFFFLAILQPATRRRSGCFGQISQISWSKWTVSCSDPGPSDKLYPKTIKQTQLNFYFMLLVLLSCVARPLSFSSRRKRKNHTIHLSIY